MSSDPKPDASPAVQLNAVVAAAGLPLRPSENALALLEVDLTRQLHFGQGVLVITSQRLLTRFPDATTWQSWDIGPDLVLTHSDYAGVGTLSLRDRQGQLAVWRFTLGHNPAAIQLLDRFEQVRAAAGGSVALPDDSEHAGAAPGHDADEGPEDKPPSTWTLLRLWRFAHPYRWQPWPAA